VGSCVRLASNFLSLVLKKPEQDSVPIGLTQLAEGGIEPRLYLAPVM
jgi:hypothetical protein